MTPEPPQPLPVNPWVGWRAVACVLTFGAYADVVDRRNRAARHRWWDEWGAWYRDQTEHRFPPSLSADVPGERWCLSCLGIVVWQVAVQRWVHEAADHPKCFPLDPTDERYATPAAGSTGGAPIAHAVRHVPTGWITG